MEKNRYIEDILDQPAALRAGINHYDPQVLEGVANDLKAGRFDRIVMTGLGASYFGSYPAWLHLAQAGLPAWWVETSELLHYSMPLITPRTLVWVVSQSGMSAEIRALLDRFKELPPALLLATTNDPDSQLGREAGVVLPLHSGVESTVSTRSYVNTLAVTQMAALQLAGDSVEPARMDLLRTADGLEAYLSTWESRVEAWVELLGVPGRLMVLGRGPSLGSAQMAVLMFKESAKFEAEAMSSAEFRHGPLEMADSRLTTILIEGDALARDKNRALARELQSHHAHVVWAGYTQEAEFSTVPLPGSIGIGQGIAEIVPFQMLSIALARQTGFEPGIFRYIGKVTLIE
jgi:glucosamine--fructose-6-phosphate aminotransferase (isomerizing)